MNTVLIDYLCAGCCERVQVEVLQEELANTLRCIINRPGLDENIRWRIVESLCRECYAEKHK
jgi:hypothetical protein